LGTRGSDLRWSNWVDAYKMPDQSLEFQYTTSLHWTLTQFTPASMEVFPQNYMERIMAVVVLVFALVAFSSFVGSISTSMTTIRNMNQDINKQFWLLRRFMKQRDVPKSVATRVIRYLEYVAAKSSEKVQISSIKLVNGLSLQLQEELNYHLSYERISRHPFYRHVRGNMEPLLLKICNLCLKQYTLAVDDVLFRLRDEGTHMYFQVTGEVEYRLMDHHAVAPLQDYEWLAEAVLWLPWKHMGRATARRETELVGIDGQKFGEVLSMFIDTWFLAATYAHEFLTFSLSFGLTDLIRQGHFYDEVAPSILQKAMLRFKSQGTTSVKNSFETSSQSSLDMKVWGGTG